MAHAGARDTYLCESASYLIKIAGTNPNTGHSGNFFEFYKKSPGSNQQILLDGVLGQLTETANFIAFSTNNRNQSKRVELMAGKSGANRWEGRLWFDGQEQKLNCKLLPKKSR